MQLLLLLSNDFYSQSTLYYRNFMFLFVVCLERPRRRNHRLSARIGAVLLIGSVLVIKYVDLQFPNKLAGRSELSVLNHNR